MNRRLFTLASVLSLLLCLASLALWLRSYLALDILGSVQPNGMGYRAWSISSGKGRLSWHRQRYQFIGNAAAQDWQSWRSAFLTKSQFGPGWKSYAPMSPVPSDTFGFHFSHSSTSQPTPPTGPPRATSFTTVGIPHWLLTLLASLMPLWWIATHPRRLKASRKRSGLCPTCGYDLRATPDRCPECGSPIPADLAKPPLPPVY